MGVRHFELLYQEVHDCEKCLEDPECQMEPDPRRVPRTVVPRALSSKVFLIGQALGPNTQRLSGLPYTYPNGRLSPTGQVLDGFVRSFGYTIDPASHLPYPYSSDIVQRYPGQNPKGGGDRKPTRKEIENCSQWLDKELHLVKPRVILLLGHLPTRYFVRTYFRSSRIEWGDPYEFEIGERPATAFAVFHPSYRRRNPHVVDELYAHVAVRISEILEGAFT